MRGSEMFAPFSSSKRPLRPFFTGKCQFSGSAAKLHSGMVTNVICIILARDIVYYMYDNTVIIYKFTSLPKGSYVCSSNNFYSRQGIPFQFIQGTDPSRYQQLPRCRFYASTDDLKPLIHI